MFITNPSNIRYLTGFTGSSAMLLVSTTGATLITDFRYKTQVAGEVDEHVTVLIDSESLWNSFWKQLTKVGVMKVIGFESQHLPHRDFERLVESGARWTWRPTEDVVESLRLRKDREELAQISAAAGIATAALGVMVKNVRAGMTETQIAGVLEKALRDGGSEGFPFPTIVASGPRSALPHARTSTRVVQDGELLLVDFGAVSGGYCADVTRTFVIGTAEPRTRDIYGIVRAANDIAARELRPGMKGKEADALARSHIERCGFASGFGHGLGHGIGLQVHEAPRLSRSAEAVLPAGAVVTVEPGIYIPGWGGVRIEDDVYLSSDGPKILTHFTRDLIEIR
jgi:Xaa-Pro aminopeptidase